MIKWIFLFGFIWASVVEGQEPSALENLIVTANDLRDARQWEKARAIYDQICPKDQAGQAAPIDLAATCELNYGYLIEQWIRAGAPPNRLRGQKQETFT